MAKILVVDDQYGVRYLLLETFIRENHEVEIAESGAEALRLFIDFEPDLILMDLKMPGMDGLETLRQIRALDRQVDVIMMTCYGDIQTIEQSKGLGILYYMSKPFDLFELIDRVNDILNTARSYP